MVLYQANIAQPLPEFRKLCICVFLVIDGIFNNKEIFTNNKSPRYCKRCFHTAGKTWAGILLYWTINVLSSTNGVSLMYRAIEPAWGHTSTIFNQGSKLRCQSYWHKSQLGQIRSAKSIIYKADFWKSESCFLLSVWINGRAILLCCACFLTTLVCLCGESGNFSMTTYKRQSSTHKNWFLCIKHTCPWLLGNDSKKNLLSKFKE